MDVRAVYPHLTSPLPFPLSSTPYSVQVGKEYTGRVSVIPYICPCPYPATEARRGCLVVRQHWSRLTLSMPWSNELLLARPTLACGLVVLVTDGHTRLEHDRGSTSLLSTCSCTR